ncbi:hypothetical protein [Verrucosispora sp. WMMC514]|nr:hypothetical protein [Verrucosispora sp. WMMC514]WBB94095.1 hypothetical protein O7597_14535 [Verrucosispora sp. WMMC514]
MTTQPRMLQIRHTSAPMPEGCRWCGVPEREHAAPAREPIP